MLTSVDAATALVLRLKLALVPPAGTVTLEGTVAALVLLLESVTCPPPAGAGAFSVTVPVEELPPVTLARLTVSDETIGGITVSVARVGPVASVKLAGTPIAGLLLESVTCAPPAGAGAFSVTVPVEELPPVTLVGLTVSDEMTGTAEGVTVSVAI